MQAVRQCAGWRFPALPEVARNSTLIRYRLEPADPDGHLLAVTCEIDAPKAGQQFTLPSWIPGSYLLREFARHVVATKVHCTDEQGQQHDVTLTRIAKGTWQAQAPEGVAAATLAVHLTVFAFDLSVRGAYLDRRRAWINGPCVFPWFHGREHEPVRLALVRPAGEFAADWRVATAMRPEATDEHGFGEYAAADYDELIDHPLEMSNHARVDFHAAGIPHHLIVAGRTHTDFNRIAADVSRLCATQIEFFGGPPPFSEYWLLGMATGDGYGGLEHRSSCGLLFSRDDLPRPGEVAVGTDYQRFLGLVSHEYFHSWHVKQVKPAAFTPYRLDRRNHTRLLWVFEGITTYYQDLLLLRSGLIGVDDYLRRLAEILTRVYRTPGRLRHSIAESSFDAWDVLYKPEANTVNASVSYYGKGALTALALDLSLRSMTNARLSLDDVVRELWHRHGKGGDGLAEDGFEALVLELAGQQHTAALRRFFDEAVRGTDDLLLAPLLGALGVSMARNGAGDGKPAALSVDGDHLTLGANFRTRDGGLELVQVFSHSVAEAAGLAPGDRLVAIDGLKVTEDNIAKRLARYRAGDRLSAHAFRGDELMHFELRLQSVPPSGITLTLDNNADDIAAAGRRAWLGI